MTVSTALARALAADREGLNARVAQARQRVPGLEPDTYAHFLRSAVDPLLAAIDRLDSTRTIPAGGVLNDLALDLVVQGLAGPAARLPWVDRVWQSLAPALTPLIARWPAEALADLCHAVLNLATVPGVSIDDWLATMTELAPQLDSLPRLRAVGVIAAWRAGMAHYREGALTKADELPATVAVLACGGEANADWAPLRAALRRHPWWHPQHGGPLPGGHQVGQFSGFGGLFAAPPELRAGRDDFVVRSGDRHFLLRADAFGAVLLPASAGEFAERLAAPAAGSSTLPQALESRCTAQGLPIEGRLIIANRHTVAVFSPWSHRIQLLPLPA